MLTIINGVATKGESGRVLPGGIERDRQESGQAGETGLSLWPSAGQCQAKHLTSSPPKIVINYCVEKGGMKRNKGGGREEPAARCSKCVIAVNL